MSMDSMMTGLGSFGGGLVGYLVPFLFVLTIVVFFHELGHFLVARWCGIKVLVFSIGFGPEIIGFKDRYRLNEWTLMGAGDILLLYTDGLLEHSRENEAYFPQRVEKTVRSVKHQAAKQIFEAIKLDVLDFAAPSDDISVVVIKRT